MDEQRNVKILFDKNAKLDVLQLLGKTIDAEGYIVESANPSQKVITTDNEDIVLAQFGGVKKGSEIFIKNDLISLLKLAKR